MIVEEQGVKPEEGAAPAPSTQDEGKPAEGLPASGAAPESPAKDGVVTPGGEKTYTQAEVNRIMHERTKGFADVKKQFEAYQKLGPVEELAKLRQPAPKPEPEAPVMDEDDKKFVAYLHKLFPGLKDLGTGPKLNEEQVAFINEAREREMASQASFMQSSEDEVFKYCDTKKITDENQRVIVRDMIASVILNDPKISAKWRSKDPSAVTDAIKVLGSTLGTQTDIASDQLKAGVKAKGAFLKPGLPAGGVAAPITKERKLTDEERLDAAWGSLQGGKK